MQLNSSYLLLFVLWAVYYGLHSFLASEDAKAWFRKKSGFIAKKYRLLYSLTSIIALIPIAYVIMTVPKIEVFGGKDFFRPFSFLLVTSGIIFIRRAFKAYSLSSFLGFREEPTDRFLKKEGILGKVRHPIYTGTLLICLSFFFFSLTLSALITLTVTVIYLPFGIYLEEKKLVYVFGQEYIDYKNEVPALIPKLQF